jgi:hypothetical protein
MEKLELKKQFKNFYNPPYKAPVLVEVPRMNFLMIDGAGKPDSPSAVQAIEALYAVAYTLKFSVRKLKSIDYPVMPLEGLWWADDMNRFMMEDKANWKWTDMIMQPDLITADMVKRAVADVRFKKNPAALPKLRFEKFDEGASAEIMYFGPYADEGPTIQRIHDFLHEKGFVFDGVKQKHHEIYLSDPRRTAPEKLKTVIRQPGRKP